MDYKYFKQTSEGYEPKKNLSAMYFAVVLCSIFALLFLWYAVKTGHSDGYKFSLIFFGIIIIVVCRSRYDFPIYKNGYLQNISWKKNISV